MSFTSCRATVGHLVGQQFVSPAYAFALPLPGGDWRPVAGEASVLTLAHTQLVAGITISVTCQHERDIPLEVLTRHLLFGFKGLDILEQAAQNLDGVPALKSVARARLDGREVQLRSHVVRRDDCVYDMVYFAAPQDYAAGEPGFEYVLAGFRFLPR